MNQIVIMQPIVKVPNIGNALMQIKASKIADAMVQIRTANIHLMAF